MTESEPPIYLPARYLHANRQVVVVPARVAAFLDRAADLTRIRGQVRGADPELDAVLTALREAAMAWRGSVSAGTNRAPIAEPVAQLPWVDSQTAAAALGISDRGIRKAIAEGRLQATRVGGRWRINREDVEHYRAARRAAA
jgi:excisionase family DNA binding protein